MKALTRYAVPAAALLGLTVALAPAAGASMAKPGPVTKSTAGPSTFTTTSACHPHWTVDTAGLAHESITKLGHHRVVTFADAELGDGYTFTESGSASFSHHSHTYTFHVDGTWFNDLFPARSFHGSIKVKVFATHSDQPTGFEASVDWTRCGL